MNKVWDEVDFFYAGKIQNYLQNDATIFVGFAHIVKMKMYM